MAAGKESTIAVEIQRIAAVSWLPADTVFQRWVAAAFTAANEADPTQRQSGSIRSGSMKPGSLTIRLVDLDEGTALNSTWRHKAGPTNVLAFPGPTLPVAIADQSIEYGDLVICVPVVEREAVDQHKESINHLAHLVVHGTLHLLGYTHDAEHDAARMEALETRVLAGLGIADPYAGNGS